MSKPEHSPLPWGVDIGETVKVRTVSGHAVCDLNFVKSVPTITRLPAVQNAWFIVTACNAYYENKAAIAELVEALEQMVGLAYEASAESYGLTRHIEGAKICYEKRKLERDAARAIIAKHKSEPPAQEKGR